MFVWIFLAASALSSDRCSELVPPLLRQARSVQHHGRYFNPNYCFAVTIPKGMVGLSDPPPAPHHGFGLILSGSPQAYLYADGSYNALGLSSAWERAGLLLEYLARETPEPQATISAAHLGSTPAVRLVARFTCPGHNSLFVRDTFIALEGGVLYTLELYTTVDRYPADRLLIEEMARSWVLDFTSCHP